MDQESIDKLALLCVVLQEFAAVCGSCRRLFVRGGIAGLPLDDMAYTIPS